jgi:protoporphyrinogen oxidase
MNNYIFEGRTSRGFSENWIFGGARASAKDLLALSDEEIINMAIDERNVVLSASGEYHSYRITRWPKALPHYTADLERALPELRGLRQNTVLIGNYVQGIGLGKILEAAALLPEELLQKGEWKP